MQHLHFGDDLDAESFIDQYWQKQPLLMRSALPDISLALSPDELAGLALEPDVEARLVSHDGAERYRLFEAPFAESEFRNLPAQDWTLLVQDVDKHLPELAAFVDLFDFLPSWRFDDLMISGAAPGGGVGPHIDQYDVFLCQVTGHRRWSIGTPGHYAARADSPLRLLQDFEAAFSMTLGPGDVLYLPPGIPHDGVAVDLCTTWSIGFRAPTQLELVTELTPERAQEASDSLRYGDADLLPDEVQDGLIGRLALQRFKGLLGHLSDMGDEALLCRLGQFLTRPKAWLSPEPPDQASSDEALFRRMQAGEALSRHGMALFARARLDRKHWLFASGEALALEPAAWRLAQLLCERRQYSAVELSEHLQEPGSLAALTRLYNDGQLLLDGDL